MEVDPESSIHRDRDKRSKPNAAASTRPQQERSHSEHETRVSVATVEIAPGITGDNLFMGTRYSEESRLPRSRAADI